MKGPPRQECDHNEPVEFLYIMAGDVVGVDDLVQCKQGGVIIIRQARVYT